jgi:hypothetical protein
MPKRRLTAFSRSPNVWAIPQFLSDNSLIGKPLV